MYSSTVTSILCESLRKQVNIGVNMLVVFYQHSCSYQSWVTNSCKLTAYIRVVRIIKRKKGLGLCSSQNGTQLISERLFCTTDRQTRQGCRWFHLSDPQLGSCSLRFDAEVQRGRSDSENFSILHRVNELYRITYLLLKGIG